MTANTLILDFGGVISRTLFETHHLTEKSLGLPAGSLTWRGPFDPSSDDAWQAMQADKMSERDYWALRTQEVAELVGADWTQMSDFVKAARGASPAEVIRPEFLACLDKVKTAGLKTAILSNELDLFYGADFRKKLPFLKRFDVIHDATYTKTLKPDPAAYEAVLSALNIAPHDAVFVDDQYRNIVGAQNVGLHTVHFDVHHPSASYAAAEQSLGLSQR